MHDLLTKNLKIAKCSFFSSVKHAKGIRKGKEVSKEAYR
jgi:hypothetical protein